MRRLRLRISGAVQGVGFRPFIYRLARHHGLQGWVSNTSEGVILEVEGEDGILESFADAVSAEKPPLAIIQEVLRESLEPVGYRGFEIRKSTGGRREALVLPDMATCPECAGEIFDPEDRRYRYPFTNCTNCGPRYSIIWSIPYDRRATTMSGFEMCPECRSEYEDPMDRRFHAQPNACPACGPHLELWDPSGAVIARRDGALIRAAAEILEGGVVAVKGLGGFHLMVRADRDGPVRALRERKGRRMKPFALMFPDAGSVLRVCEVSPEEAAALCSPRAPIVLLRKGGALPMEEAVSELVAPGNSELGVMLPYTPLHLLLMRDVGRPVVATSGNLTDEPICTDEREALIRLSGLADLFLVHDRPIARHVDDSIVRIFRGREMVLRRARGYAPLPLRAHDMRAHDTGRSVLATGAHLKNTLALSVGGNIFVSQHIGDLETPQAMDAFDEVRNSIEDLYRASPSLAACDMHPDYPSSVRARESGLEVHPVQHHEAHIYSCMLDSGARPPLIGVAWDGTGYGPDGTVWGGEFFHFRVDGTKRSASFRQFRLPGGEAAVREPRRSALGVIRQLQEDPAAALPPDTFTDNEQMTLCGMMDRGLNSPLTSSVGRLFDAVASILGLRQRLEFEAQAAMELEHCIDGLETDDTYPFLLEENRGMIIVDWEPIIRGILKDRDSGLDPGLISAKFHNTLSEVVVRISEEIGERQVLLSGGCFQNRYLLERTCAVLERAGFRPVVHCYLPANDGGIAPGQVLAAFMSLDEN